MFTPTLALLLLSLAPLHAKDDPLGTIDSGWGNVTEQHRLSLGLRLGPSFLLGSQGTAYGPGAAVGLLLDVPFSDYAGFSVDAEYAGHRLSDANGLFDEDSLVLPLGQGSITGSQRHYCFDMGFRIGLGSVDESRARQSRVQAHPWFRFAGGLTVSDTLLDVPAMTGREPLRSRAPHLTLAPAFGVGIALPKLVTLQPSLKMISLLGIDHDEVDHHDALQAVWRFQPSFDVLFRF